jgi:hypothetical protein
MEVVEIDEASALGHARREGIKEGMKQEREKWQGVVADKEAEIVRLREELSRK